MVCEGVGGLFRVGIGHTQKPNSQHKVDLLPWWGEGLGELPLDQAKASSKQQQQQVGFAGVGF